MKIYRHLYISKSHRLHISLCRRALIVQYIGIVAWLYHLVVVLTLSCSDDDRPPEPVVQREVSSPLNALSVTSTCVENIHTN